MGSNKLRFFQLGLLILFGFFAIIGVIAIALHKSDSDGVSIQSQITIWGPSFDGAISSIIEKKKSSDKSFEKITYVSKNPATIYADLLEAIATGNSPDLVVLNSSGLLPLKNKLVPIPYSSFPLSTFRSMYVKGAEAFALSDGIYALPFLVDPLVLYWNRDLFATKSVVSVPEDWETLIQLTPRFTVISNTGTLSQGAIALGEYDNIVHAKEIISSLFMQTGASVTYESSDRKIFETDLKSEVNDNRYALALKFFTSFSNPNKVVYSWNKTFDDSVEAFTANKIAMYIGYAGERKLLSQINPNLNFDMTMLPQRKGTLAGVTYGNFYGIGILKSSPNVEQAYVVAQLLTEALFAKEISEAVDIPSTRTDVLSEMDTADPFSNTKLQSALIAKTWLEPYPQSGVNSAFSHAVNGIVSGTLTPEVGATQVAKDIEVLLDSFNKK